MDLYDDLDTKQRAGQIDGWSSGIKLMQSQLALKKPVAPAPTRKDFFKRSTVMTPVMQLKSKQRDADGDDIFSQTTSATSYNRPKFHPNATTTTITSSAPILHTTNLTPSSKVFNDYDWDVVDEYDPLWPNEYEKLVKERRDKDSGSDAKQRTGDKRNEPERYHGGFGSDRKRRNTRFEHDASPSAASSSSSTTTKSKYSGFGGRPDEEEAYERSSPPSGSDRQGPRSGGAAIAPPPSLQESTPIIPAFANLMAAGGKDAAAYGSNSVAAKIMAKYGFKDGQGLGKQEQGMSMALQVEKTSKRGGRIVHEREALPAGSTTASAAPSSTSPPRSSSPTMMPPPPFAMPASTVPFASAATTTSSSAAKSVTAGEEPTITEIMRAPSKVVLLRNMVGPGDVDNDLEPEVKDECNTKYGDVVSCIINEIKDVVPEEAVRIFVEFKRIESAIKAVVDLNGRFFGGRQVKAGFFGFDKYKAFQLYD